MRESLKINNPSKPGWVTVLYRDTHMKVASRCLTPIKTIHFP